MITAERARELLQKDSVTGDWRIDNGVIVSEWDSERTTGRIPLAQVFHEGFGELMAAAPEMAKTVVAQAETLARVAALADKWEHGALRWADPLPVPPEVALLREALGVSA